LGSGLGICGSANVAYDLAHLCASVPASSAGCQHFLSLYHSALIYASTQNPVNRFFAGVTERLRRISLGYSWQKAGNGVAFLAILFYHIESV
jgi:hypothetical protein